MRYLSKEEILLLHSLVIEETGGRHGVRDHNALLSIEALPSQIMFGKKLYDTLHLKAAVYAHSIIMNHPFVDGNKRTGMLVAGVFLEDNGFQINARRGLVAKFALKIIENHLAVQEIGQWFEKYSEPVKGE